jgi:hypothetical protein
MTTARDDDVGDAVRLDVINSVEEDTVRTVIDPSREYRNEMARFYYALNRAEILERRRLYRALHRDAVNARRREYYRENRERILAQQRVRHHVDRDEINVNRRINYAVKSGRLVW